MIKIITEEDNIKIIKLVNDEEFDLLKEIGVTEEDKLISTWEKIDHHICDNHHKGAVCIIDEEDLTEQEKELLKIRKKIEEKETYITY